MTDHLTSRAQRLIEEFEEGESVRHGLANVLTHLADAWGDPESWYAVPASTLKQLATELTAPTLLGQALASDRRAARQFLQELGVVNANGQLSAPYRPGDRNN